MSAEDRENNRIKRQTGTSSAPKRSAGDSREGNRISRQAAQRYEGRRATTGRQRSYSHPHSMIDDAVSGISGAGASVGKAIGGAINAVRGVTGGRGISNASSSQSRNALNSFKQKAPWDR